MSDPRLNNREMITKFINEASKLPALWQKKHRDYLNRNIKNNCYEQLSAIMKDYIPEATANLARSKWNNIKSAYIRQKNEILSSQRPGAAPQDIKVPTLWYYHLMYFLNESLESRPSVIAVKQESSEYSDGDESCTAGESFIEEATHSKGIPKKRSQAQTRKRKRDALLDLALLEFGTKQSRSVNEAFGDYIGKELEEVNPSQAALARKLIMEVVFEARQNTLMTRGDT